MVGGEAGRPLAARLRGIEMMTVPELQGSHGMFPVFPQWSSSVAWRVSGGKN